MAKKAEAIVVHAAGRDVTISNPNKVLFPDAGHTKLDLVNYYLAVADGALRGAGGRPNVLVRYPNGLGEEFFYQLEGDMVLRTVAGPGEVRYVPSLDDVPAVLVPDLRPGDLVLTMGAGDITTLGPRLLEALGG